MHHHEIHMILKQKDKSLLPLQKLTEIKGLSETKVEKMLDACKKVCIKFGYITAKELDEIREREIGKSIIIFFHFVKLAMQKYSSSTPTGSCSLHLHWMRCCK